MPWRRCAVESLVLFAGCDVGAFIDMVGQRYGRTVVGTLMPTTKVHTRWACVCDCGMEHIANASDLRSGRTRSCGCLHHEIAISACKTHGKSKTREYKIWQGIKDRCLNAANTSYADYGARGITVDPAWMSFSVFLADMGDAPKGYSIDRINNNAGYSKNNCRWATQQEQCRNKRTSKLGIDDACLVLTLIGQKVSLRKLAKLFAVSTALIADISKKRAWVDATPLPV